MVAVRSGAIRVVESGVRAGSQCHGHDHGRDWRRASRRHDCGRPRGQRKSIRRRSPMARGVYRIPVRVGTYRISADLAGFTRVERMGVQLLVGQSVTLNMQMSPSTVQETVTVTGEAPLIETTQSSVGGNIDPLQMTELPVQGNQWIALALLAPGNRTTLIGDEPVTVPREDNPAFALNLDGQQVGNTLGALNQPRYSRDTIAEFEFVSNRFDATQGRSPAAMVNAVTKSGTNAFTGLVQRLRSATLTGTRRTTSSSRKVPFKNQQISGAAGGPIVRDRVHYFGNYEYNRTPLTLVREDPLPALQHLVERQGNDQVVRRPPRLPVLAECPRHVQGRRRKAVHARSASLGANHLASATYYRRGLLAHARHDDQRPVQPRAQRDQGGLFLHALAAGAAEPLVEPPAGRRWHQCREPHHPVPRLSDCGQRAAPADLGAEGHDDPRRLHVLIRRRRPARPEAGRRVPLFAEPQHQLQQLHGHLSPRAVARRRPQPQMESLFPDPFNVDTWNLAPLNPLVQRYEIAVGDFYRPDTLPKYGAWIQDDWQISNRLTLNLGLRYDLIWNAFAQHRSFLQWMAADRPQDAEQPAAAARLRLLPQRPDRPARRQRALLRGHPGRGAELGAIAAEGGVHRRGGRRPVRFRGEPVQRPAGRPTIRRSSGSATSGTCRAACTATSESCRRRRSYAGVPLMWQSSVGFQRQFAGNSALTADYVYFHGADENILLPNINLTYDEATGANYPSSRHRPAVRSALGHRSGWTRRPGGPTTTACRRRSRSGSATGGRRRPPTRCRASGTAIRSRSAASAKCRSRWPKDLGNDYSLAVTDQRHRARVQRHLAGRRRLPGERHATSTGRASGMSTIYGEDLRGVGEGFEAFALRLRPRRHRSCRATASSATRSTAWTSGCRSGSRSAGRVGDRRHRGSVQPVRSRQLRLVRDRRIEPAVRAAGVQLESRVCAADAAAGLQADVLTHLRAGWDGVPSRRDGCSKHGWHRVGNRRTTKTTRRSTFKSDCTVPPASSLFRAVIQVGARSVERTL